MYNEKSGLEILFGVIVGIAIIPIAIVVNGQMIAYAWSELLLPIFPNMPVINFWQGVGLSTFVSMFTMGIARADSGKESELSTIVFRVFFQWAFMFFMIWAVSQSY